MKEKVSKKVSKQITFIIVLVMLCNFIVPNYSYAVSTESGGILVKIISQFVCSILDSCIDFLQDMFITNVSIEIPIETDGTGLLSFDIYKYKIQYSPAIIFSGKVPAFDINFINPNTDIREIRNLSNHKVFFLSQIDKRI